jgi:hypothetical protein
MINTSRNCLAHSVGSVREAARTGAKTTARTTTATTTITTTAREIPVVGPGRQRPIRLRHQHCASNNNDNGIGKTARPTRTARPVETLDTAQNSTLSSRPEACRRPPESDHDGDGDYDDDDDDQTHPCPALGLARPRGAVVAWRDDASKHLNARLDSAESGREGANR